MVSKICPSCGKKIEKGEVTINNLCQECFLEKAQLLGEKRNIEIRLCKRCLKIKHKMETRKFGRNEPESIKNYVKEYPNFLFKPKGKITSLEFKELKKVGDHYKAKIKFWGRVNKKQTKDIEEEAEIRIELDRSYCKRCMKIKQQKYQAKLQIRGKKIDLNDPLFKGKGIIKIEEKKRGWNLYFLRHRKAKIVARKLNDRYNGELSQHPSLISEENGERIYRYTYSLKI